MGLMCSYHVLCSHMQICVVLLCWSVVRATTVLDAGDIIFAPSDLKRKRHVVVHPGHRVVLIEEWPGPGSKKKKSKLPKVKHAEVVPQDRRGDFTLPWLRNVVLYAINGSELIKPRRVDVDEDMVLRLTEIFDEALEHGTEDQAALSYVRQLREELSAAIGGECLDDPLFNSRMEGLMRAVLSVFGDRRRLSWAVKHMFEDAYLEGNELMLGDLHTKDLGFDFRMHVWHEFTKPRNISFYSMPHEHGQTLLAATQVIGQTEQHIYWTGGEKYGDGGFDPILLRIDEGEQVTLDRVQMEGSTLYVKAGETYVFPTRWTHTIVPKKDSQDSISLELRKALFGKNCKGNNPPRIRVLDHWTKPERFTDMLYFRWPALRQKVAGYLAGEIAELNIDGPHLDLTPAEEKELASTQRFVEGMKVRITKSVKAMRKAFRSAPKRYDFDERMAPMAGYVFTVWKQLSDRMVSLIDPADGLGIGPSLLEPFYFPPNILTLVTTDNEEL